MTLRKSINLFLPSLQQGTFWRINKIWLGLTLWPGVHTLCFGGPGFHRLRSWAQTRHCSSSHAEAASHMPQLEGPATKIYNYELGNFGEKKKKRKRRLAADASSGAKFKKRKSVNSCTRQIRWSRLEQAWPHEVWGWGRSRGAGSEHICSQANPIHPIPEDVDRVLEVWGLFQALPPSSRVILSPSSFLSLSLPFFKMPTLLD